MQLDIHTPPNCPMLLHSKSDFISMHITSKTVHSVLLLPLLDVLFPLFPDMLGFVAVDGFGLKLRDGAVFCGFTSFFLKSELSLPCNGTLAGTLCRPVVLEFLDFCTVYGCLGNDAAFCGAGFNSFFLESGIMSEAALVRTGSLADGFCPPTFLDTAELYLYSGCLVPLDTFIVEPGCVDFGLALALTSGMVSCTCTGFFLTAEVSGVLEDAIEGFVEG